MVRPDYLEANPDDRDGGGAGDFSRRRALSHAYPTRPRRRCAAHRLYTQDKLAEDVFDLSHDYGRQRHARPGAR